MVEPSNSFYTVEGGRTFWNMVEHCGMFQYHMHGITQQALLCSALHCFPQSIYNWVGNCFIMDFLFLVSCLVYKDLCFVDNPQLQFLRISTVSSGLPRSSAAVHTLSLISILALVLLLGVLSLVDSVALTAVFFVKLTNNHYLLGISTNCSPILPVTA